jgi:N-acetylglucosaminyldiphosphoundecaprenol N-acetyl-beta-D-mannosaminyltransferase
LVAEPRVLGCRVDPIGRAEAVDRIVALARGETPRYVVTLGTEMVVQAQRDPRFAAVLDGAAFRLCDTVGVLWAARDRGIAVPERVTGVELLAPLCAALARDGIAVYLLGGRGDTAPRAAAALQRAHPRLVVAGTRDGYFAETESAAVAATIAASGARVLLVALGSPRQEMWLADHLAATGCGVGIGVGGSFDVLAGNVRRAPAAWRSLGVEWLYRLVTEPHRWRRQLALPRFVLLALRERWLPLRRSQS